MKTNVYAIFDEKAEIYGTPFFMHNDALAHRAFDDLRNDPGSTLYKHPTEFKLYRIGSFSDDSGLLIPETQPEFIAHGKSNYNAAEATAFAIQS